MKLNLEIKELICFFTKELTQNKTWIDGIENKFGSHVCKEFNSLVSYEMKKSKSYINARVSQANWLVTWKSKENDTLFIGNESFIIPIFERKRTLTYDSGILTCSCICYKVDSFPCRYIINVVYSIDGYDGLLHHDISVK